MAKLLKSSTVLKLAKKEFLPDFLCFAVKEAEAKLLGRSLSDYCGTANCEVGEWLDNFFSLRSTGSGYETFFSWMLANSLPFRNEWRALGLEEVAGVGGGGGNDLLDKYRGEWVDRLIEFYESQGD